MPAVERLGTLLVQKMGQLGFETVLAPAMGGLVIGQEVARQAKSRFIFAEKSRCSLGCMVRTNSLIISGSN